MVEQVSDLLPSARQVRSFRNMLFNWSLFFKRRWGFGKKVLSFLPLWVTPNTVTITRTLLVAPIFFCIHRGWYLAAFVISGISFAGDFADGALADLRNQKTALGAFLDPLSDKIVNCGILLYLVPRLPFAFGPPIIICCCIAIALTVIRLFRIARVWRKKQDVKAKTVQSKPAGKLKAVCEVAAILLLFIGLSLDSLAVVWTAGVLLFLSVLFAAWSLYAQAKARV